MRIQVVRKKPVQVEAVQWTGNAQEAAEIVAWILDNGGNAKYRAPAPGFSEPNQIIIETDSGTTYAPPKWWIIRGVKGEFYPCAPEVYDMTYEGVSLESP